MTGLISIELTFSPPCHSSSNYLFLTILVFLKSIIGVIGWVFGSVLADRMII